MPAMMNIDLVQIVREGQAENIEWLELVEDLGPRTAFDELLNTSFYSCIAPKAKQFGYRIRW